MSKEQIEEMRKDLIGIFNEEYDKRNLITADNTAEKMLEKGYHKQSECLPLDVHEDLKQRAVEKAKVEVVEEIDGWFMYCEEYSGNLIKMRLAELKKKYT